MRRQDGGLDLTTIEVNEPDHLEMTFRMRARPSIAYGIVDMTDARTKHVTLSLNIVPEGTTAQTLRIDAAERAVVIDSLAAKTDRNYVFADVARRIVDSLRARRARGAYDRYTNQLAFAERLRIELLDLSHDKHIGVNYVPFALPAGPSPTPPPGGPPANAPQMRLPPCVFEQRTLDDDTGYVKFDVFRQPQECAKEAAAMMNGVATTRALIVDLRTNGGGAPEMVAFIASYLVSKRTHLNDQWTRATGQTEEFWSSDDVPGPRFGGEKPVYVLTSARTFSGGEELAYDLQALKRATIVGEVTGGGAHVTATGRIGDHLLLSLPIRRAINPVTKTNWEGVGVQPDVKVRADSALVTAQRLIRDRR